MWATDDLKLRRTGSVKRTMRVSVRVCACAQVWAMDDLKCMRTLKGHDGAVTGVGLLPGGIPCSGSEEGTVMVSAGPSQRLLA